MTKADEAVQSFKDGFSCSQAILAAYGPAFGLDRLTALKVSGSFGGGMASMGDTCGAVTGAFMVLGLKHGRTDAKDVATREKNYSCVKEFCTAFKARNKSIVCRDLLGCDLGTPEGRQYAKDHRIPPTICPKFVKDAAEILEDLLTD